MLLIVFGTRPEWLKFKPLIDELQKRKYVFNTLFTGQHKDLIDDISNITYRRSIEAEFNYDEGVDRLSAIVGVTIENVSAILSHNPNKYKYVIVQGDTSSALAGALAAFHCKVKVIHLEAGLRTNDIESPFPEEMNRQLISRIADVHLCPTKKNAENLIRESIHSDEIHVVGNTGLDNLMPYRKKLNYGNKVLVTLHRRENHEIIDQYFYQLAFLAEKYKELEFILPIHPNPNVQKHRHILENSSVKVIEPLPHGELLDILVDCNFVITDSGGLQEECNFLDKKCIVCRTETERPEAFGMTTYLCLQPNFLEKIVKGVYSDPVPYNEYPFGDGHSSKKIVDIFEELIYKDA